MGENEFVENLEMENGGAVNDWALDNVIGLEAHGDERDGFEGDGSEGDIGEGDGNEGDEDDFLVMTSSWGGQVDWLEEDDEEEEDEEDGEPDEEEVRVSDAQGEEGVH